MTVSYSGTIPSPVGHVAINEIMWNPSVANAEYVELFNNSTNVTYDLSGWQLQGLSYTFPPGSLLPAAGISGPGGQCPGLCRGLRRDQSCV